MTAAMVVGLLTAEGCSSTDDDDGTSPGTPSTTPTATPASTPTNPTSSPTPLPPTPTLLPVTPTPLPVTPTPVPPTPEPPLECTGDLTPPDLPVGKWTLSHPAPGGDIRTLSTSAAAPTLVYAGSSSNGLYVSQNGGLTWIPTRAPRTHVYSQVAVHQANPGTIAFSSGEAWMSTNTGADWVQLPVGEASRDGSIYGLTWDGDTLYAIDAISRVYRSDDYGAHFTQVGQPVVQPPPPASQANRSEAMMPMNGNHTLTSEYWWLAVSPGVVLAQQNGGNLYISKDKGANWTNLRGGHFVWGTLVVQGASIYIAETSAVYTSPDLGKTWTNLGSVGSPITSLSVSPKGTIAVATSDGAWVYNNGKFIDRPDAQAVTPQAVRYLPDSSLLLGHAEGVARSLDDGSSWQDASTGMIDTDEVLVLPHPVCWNMVWSGTQCERGGFASTNWGMDWTHISTYMHYVMEMEVNDGRPRELFVTSDDHLLESPDLGETWVQINPSWMEVHLHGVSADPFHPDTILTGSVGSGLYEDTQAHIYRSDDDGLSWSLSDEGFPFTAESVQDIHFSDEVEGVVLAGTFRGGDIAHNGDKGIGLYRSTDYGHSWTKADLDVLDVAKIEECDGRIYAATDGGIAVSDDDGVSWDFVLEPTTTEFIAAACDGDTVLVSDQLTNLYRSDDRGENWYSWRQGLESAGDASTNDYLMELAFSGDGSTAYLAWRAKGVFLRPVKE